jgi:hypothetical protein
MFEGRDGACRICATSCLQIRDLSPHLCGVHLGEFIKQKSKSRNKAPVVMHVEQLVDVDRRNQQERYLAQTLLHGQGADDEQSGSVQSNTPKRQNWPRTRNPYIDDQAGVARDGDDDDVEYDNNTDDQSGEADQPCLSICLSIQIYLIINLQLTRTCLVLLPYEKMLRRSLQNY